MKVRILITIGILFCLACQAQVVDCCELEQETVIATVPLYIFAGQSNMGRSVMSEMTASEVTAYDQTYTDVKMYNVRAGSSFADLNIGSNTYLDNATEFGAEASFIKNLQTYNSGEKYLLKHGVGNTAIQYWLTTGYTNLINGVADAVSEMAAAGKYPRLAAFYWMQGENDATNSTTAANYGTNLSSFFTRFKISFDSIMNVNGFDVRWDWCKVIGRIGNNNVAIQPYNADVRAAQEAFCANASNNAILIDTDDLPLKDLVHYSATGQITLGERIFNQIKGR
jgi:hypothetical protein